MLALVVAVLIAYDYECGRKLSASLFLGSQNQAFLASWLWALIVYIYRHKCQLLEYMHIILHMCLYTKKAVPGNCGNSETIGTMIDVLVRELQASTSKSKRTFTSSNLSLCHLHRIFSWAHLLWLRTCGTMVVKGVSSKKPEIR